MDIVRFYGLAAALCSITLITGFIAFPLAQVMLEMGVGVMRVAIFVSTLMMAGVVSAPMETRFFNRKTILLRNDEMACLIEH